MKYRSKVDWWYYIIIMLFTYCTVHVVYCFFTNNSSKEHPLLLVLFLLCEFLFLLPNLFLTYYIFEESCMYIRSGYFLWKNIDYSDIVKIRETKSLFSPSGLSMERIEITYKYKDSINTVLISPKKKKDVLNILDEKVQVQSVSDLSGFAKQEADTNNLPMNAIFKKR